MHPLQCPELDAGFLFPRGNSVVPTHITVTASLLDSQHTFMGARSGPSALLLRVCLRNPSGLAHHRSGVWLHAVLLLTDIPWGTPVLAVSATSVVSICTDRWFCKTLL